MNHPESRPILHGQERATGSQGTAGVPNPATEEVPGVPPQAGPDEAAVAAAIARQGFAEWSALSAPERGRTLRRAEGSRRSCNPFS